MLKRLARWLDPVETVDQTRLRGGSDAVERGIRWETFYREEGGLLDMLEAERRELFEAMGALDPADIGKVYWLATADRIVRRLQKRVETIVVTGKLQADSIRVVDGMKNLTRVDIEF
jgi:hypothetical protein